MRRRLIALLVVGHTAIAAAIAISLRPELAKTIGVTPLLRTVENGYFLAATLAGLGIFYALYTGISWWLAGGVHQVSVPAVERLPTSGVPGSEFDRALPELAGKRGQAARPVEHRELIRERLTTDAIRTVARVHNFTDEAARERVAAGNCPGRRPPIVAVIDDRPLEFRGTYIFKS